MLDEHVQQALQPFFDEGWISDVLIELKSGKEATVFCCAAGPRATQSGNQRGADVRQRRRRDARDLAQAPAVANGLLAAKVYRPLDERGFRNDAVYRAGQVILNQRNARALANKTAFGRELQAGSWMYAEWENLRTLYAAGADVPRTFRISDSAILMEFIGDEEGAASTLNRVDLPREEAPQLFRRLMENIELWLRLDRIHGDLSPFNVLYWQGNLTVIDFPQAVDPRFNPHAFDLLHRDISNVCRYFSRYGVTADPFVVTSDLWRRFEEAEL